MNRSHTKFIKDAGTAVRTTRIPTHCATTIQVGAELVVTIANKHLQACPERRRIAQLLRGPLLA